MERASYANHATFTGELDVHGDRHDPLWRRRRRRVGRRHGRRRGMRFRRPSRTCSPRSRHLAHHARSRTVGRGRPAAGELVRTTSQTRHWRVRGASDRGRLPALTPLRLEAAAAAPAGPPMTRPTDARANCCYERASEHLRRTWTMPRLQDDVRSSPRARARCSLALFRAAIAASSRDAKLVLGLMIHRSVAEFRLVVNEE